MLFNKNPVDNTSLTKTKKLYDQQMNSSYMGPKWLPGQSYKWYAPCTPNKNNNTKLTLKLFLFTSHVILILFPVQIESYRTKNATG